MNKIYEFANILTEMEELYVKKNADYGDSFGKSFKEYGAMMACIRLEDKLNRFKSLVKNGECKVKEESLIDTLIDLANYSVMTIIEIQNTGENN